MVVSISVAISSATRERARATSAAAASTVTRATVGSGSGAGAASSVTNWRAILTACRFMAAAASAWSAVHWPIGSGHARSMASAICSAMCIVLLLVVVARVVVDLVCPRRSLQQPSLSVHVVPDVLAEVGAVLVCQRPPGGRPQRPLLDTHRTHGAAQQLPALRVGGPHLQPTPPGRAG